MKSLLIDHCPRCGYVQFDLKDGQLVYIIKDEKYYQGYIENVPMGNTDWLRVIVPRKDGIDIIGVRIEDIILDDMEGKFIENYSLYVGGMAL